MCIRDSLYGFEYVTAGKVDGGCHLERQLDIGFRGGYQCVYHPLYVTSGKVVRFQFVARDVLQSCFMSFNHAGHNDIRRNITDTHQEKLYQRDVYSRYFGRQARTALVRRVGNAVQRDHLAGVALKGGLGGGTTDLEASVISVRLVR